ncbi:MAG: site-2 protease family protein, partial [Opitutales bacterium]
MSPSDIKSLLGAPWAMILALFFLCASILIHELGHFLAARWRGLVVERFSIGFGPRLFGWTRGGVDYRISAIPLGGYVALPQLAGVRALEGESGYVPDELPPLKAGDKIIVSLAGPLFNILFALLLGVVIWQTGRPANASEQTTAIGYAAREVRDAAGDWVPGPARAAGLMAEDKILSIDGTPVREWTDIVQAIATSSGYDAQNQRVVGVEVNRKELSVERGGQILTFAVKPVLSSGTGLRDIGILPLRPAVVGEVFPNSPAMSAGLMPGDRILSVDGEAIGHIFTAGKLIAQTPPVPH